MNGLKETFSRENLLKNLNFFVLLNLGLVLTAVGIVYFKNPNHFAFGGTSGLSILLADLIIWRRMEGKEPIHLSGKTLGTVALAVVGALLLGVGMCLSMVFGKMVLGIAVGIIGIVVLLMLIPLTKGLK